MSTTAHIPLFFATFLRHPLRIGSIAPSTPSLGRHIATAMIDSLSLDDSGCGVPPAKALIVELGAGTGPITQEICAAGIAPDHLAINELDPSLLAILHRDFPKSLIIGGDASQMSSKIPSDWLGKVSVVVSSLPVRNFTYDMRTRLIDDIFRILRPGGVMVQYTYPLGCPLEVKPLGLKGELHKRVLFNFPPAAIWQFRKIRSNHGC